MEAMEKWSNCKIRQVFSQCVFVAIVLVVIGGLAVSANALLASVRDAPLPDYPGGPASIVIQATSRKRVETELITLRPTGFEPSEVTRSRGQFLLAVDNRTGLEDLTLWLERENGARQQEVHLANRRVRWRTLINPPPGTYVLKVGRHPDWICRIIIN